MKRFNGLVVFDLDGTLLKGPSICELISIKIGKFDRMKYLERFSSKQDLSEARKEMISWYSKYSLDELILSIKDAEIAPGTWDGISLLKENNIAIGIASMTWEFAVKYFATKFGIQFYIGTELEENVLKNQIWPEDKAYWLIKLSKNLGVSKNLTAAIGDSVNDSYMLRTAKYSFFLGELLPKNLNGVVHLPCGDIKKIAELIVGKFIK